MIFTAIQLENLLLFFLSVHQTLEKFKQGSIRFQNNIVNAKHFYPFTAQRAAKQA